MDLQSIDDSFFQDLASYQPAVDEANDFIEHAAFCEVAPYQQPTLDDTDAFFEDAAFRDLAAFQQPSVEQTNHFFDETWHRYEGNDDRLLGNFPANTIENGEYLFTGPNAFEPPISVEHDAAFLLGNTSELQEPDLIASYLSGPDFTQHWTDPITFDSAVELDNATNGSGHHIGGHGFLGVADDAKEGIATSLETPFDITEALEPLLNEISESQLVLPLLAPKSKRTRISKAAKKVLEEYFGSNPYPNEYERSSLVRATQLTGRTIKDWFSNTRSRKGTTQVQARDLSNESNGNARLSLRGTSPAQSVCRASLEALEKHSPTDSMSSLQRYIEAPVTEEAIPKEALDAIHGQFFKTTLAPPVSGKRFGTVLSPRRRATSSRESNSVAGSNGSRGSARSDGTHLSLKSQDSRGSRRGRKLWKRAQQDADSRPILESEVPIQAHASEEVPTDDLKYPMCEATDPPLLPYFCTWSDCSARFRFRWEWARHETALHYQPHHWICCPADSRLKFISQCFVCGLNTTTVGHIMDTHFTECTTKSRGEVTFLREDQLIQHIKGVHAQQKASKKVCKELLSLSKTQNKDMDSSALDCGFCGRVSESWAEREDHVFEHLKEGMCKSAWWVGRLPVPSGSCAHGEAPALPEMIRPHKPPSRIIWSCRYLYDYHALFKTFGAPKGHLVSACQLCSYHVTGTEDEVKYRADTRRHAESHSLRLCSQTQFSTIVDFVDHLTSNHGAILACLVYRGLDSWTCQQELTWQGDQCIAGTARTPARSTTCQGMQDLFDGLPCL